MKIIVISSEKFSEGEDKAFNLLFEAGLETLHLRKPGAGEMQYDILLQKIDPKYYSRVVLHDHFLLAEKYNLKGVHLNRRNPGHSGSKHLSVSRSCHTIEELESYKQYDYLFLSPIFNSISKSGYVSNFSEKDLSDAFSRRLIDSHVVALGGIDDSNIEKTASYGFGGVAVLGAVWQDFDIDHDFIQLMDRFQNLRMKVG